MRRSRKRYVLNPLHNTAKYAEESQLCRKYGLKNKKQLGKSQALLLKYRALVKSTSPAVVQPAIEKLMRLGLLHQAHKQKILQLTVDIFLGRRLQTIVANKFKLSPRAARQLITHGHVFVADKRARFPGYLVRVENEPLIRIKA